MTNLEEFIKNLNVSYVMYDFYWDADTIAGCRGFNGYANIQ